MKIIFIINDVPQPKIKHGGKEPPQAGDKVVFNQVTYNVGLREFNYDENVVKIKLVV